MIDKITLEGVLPLVFAGSENEPPVCNSHVWLRNITFARPQYWLIEAESGTGKSSLCAFVYGSRTDYSGTIRFDGRDIREFSVKQWCELRRTSLAYLPQEMYLFPELTVMENIDIKNRLTGCKTSNQIMEMLETLEIAQKVDVPTGHLSVGQQQRVAIIRALCQPFDFLLIDEPVSHLDARNNRSVAAMIDAEARARGAGVIATSVGNKIVLPDFNILEL